MNDNHLRVKIDSNSNEFHMMNEIRRWKLKQERNESPEWNWHKTNDIDTLVNVGLSCMFLMIHILLEYPKVKA